MLRRKRRSISWRRKIKFYLGWPPLKKMEINNNKIIIIKKSFPLSVCSMIAMRSPRKASKTFCIGSFASTKKQSTSKELAVRTTESLNRIYLASTGHLWLSSGEAPRGNQACLLPRWQMGRYSRISYRPPSIRRRP